MKFNNANRNNLNWSPSKHITVIGLRSLKQKWPDTEITRILLIHYRRWDQFKILTKIKALVSVALEEKHCFLEMENSKFKPSLQVNSSQILEWLEILPSQQNLQHIQNEKAKHYIEFVY